MIRLVNRNILKAIALDAFVAIAGFAILRLPMMFVGAISA